MPSYEPSLNIVIADDDTVTRSALRMLLREQRHVVIGEAADGEKAFEVCLNTLPDVVFIDINMPKLNGHELSARLTVSLPGTRIIIISSLPTVANVQQAMQGGACAFVVKPFNTVKVIEALAKCAKVSR